MIDLSKKILYEDGDILVIDKPAGLVVHPDGRTKEPSVSEWFVTKYPKSRDVGEPLRLSSGQAIERPGIVHRIDRETSGVLLLAKTKKGHQHLKKQFQNREIEKIYHLFVHGNVKDNQGTIDRSIGRSASDFRKWVALRPLDSARGKEALTYFQVLKRASDKSVTFLEAKPKTGRTHQIRVHFKDIHHPVISDKLYAPKKPRLLGFNRLALHARKITFKDISNEEHSVVARYPKDFEQAIDIIS